MVISLTKKPNILDAPRISMSDAAERLGVDVSTAWRWALKGVRGRKLPTIMIGGRRFVLESSLSAWIEAGLDPESRTGASRSADAERELDRRGI